MKLKQWAGLFLAVLILFMGAFDVYNRVGNSQNADSTFVKRDTWESYFNDIAEQSKSSGKPNSIDEDYFAHIDVCGTISSTGSEYDSSVCDTSKIVEIVDELMEDDKNKGILLNVDSPGGEAYASDVLFLKLKEYKNTTKRPIVAYVNSMSASGAYYISCAADYIVAQRSAWIGSIGVYVQITDTTALEKKIGLHRYLIRSAKNKGMGSSFMTLTPEQKKIYQNLVDDAYQQFVGAVMYGRKQLNSKQVYRIADGRTYTAKQSLSNKLIDQVGAYDDAVSQLGKLADGEYSTYTMETSTFLNRLLSSFGTLVPKTSEEIMQQTLENKGSKVMYLAK